MTQIFISNFGTRHKNYGCVPKDRSKNWMKNKKMNN